MAMLVGVLVLIAIAVIIVLAVVRGGWTVSSNGNQTLAINGLRVTVFERDGGWKFCVAISEEDEDPYFSDRYASEQEAKDCALAYISGRPAPHRSKKEHNEAVQIASYSTALQRSKDIYIESYDKLKLIHDSKKFLLTALRPIKKRLDRSERHLIEAYKHFYSDGDQAHADEIWELRNLTKSLEGHVDDLISWIQNGREKANVAVPVLTAD